MWFFLIGRPRSAEFVVVVFFYLIFLLIFVFGSGRPPESCDLLIYVFTRMPMQMRAAAHWKRSRNAGARKKKKKRKVVVYGRLSWYKLQRSLPTTFLFSNWSGNAGPFILGTRRMQGGDGEEEEEEEEDEEELDEYWCDGRLNNRVGTLFGWKVETAVSTASRHLLKVCQVWVCVSVCVCVWSKTECAPHSNSRRPLPHFSRLFYYYYYYHYISALKPGKTQ